MKRIGPLTLTLTCVLGLHLVPLAGRAAADIPQFGYIVTDLGTFGGNESHAEDLNNEGQVVGTSKAGDGASYGFRYSNGVMSSLASLFGTNPVPFSINNAGAMVGLYTSETPFVSKGSTFTPLDITSAVDIAEDINDAGLVVGYSYQDSSLAWVKDTTGGQVVQLTDSLLVRGRARALNSAGAVVGAASLHNPNGETLQPFHATLWKPVPGFYTRQDLGTLGGLTSEALAINVAGEIAGWAYTASGYKHAFLWTPPPYRRGESPMKDLGALPSLAELSVAHGINSQGQIVGQSTLVLGSILRAVSWQNGQIVDLNSHIPTNSGWELTDATAINDKGQICGTGLHNGQVRAFLLTPLIRVQPFGPPG